ncbi:MAG: selenium cofactor biosynthesis protein YqeC [Anaerolineae bacterium]|nr:selenium cofactor biosynthesis protein YqeC [Anaerolineae bacterium]
MSKALNINRGDIVSFVGAGGKTTAMYRLAHELVSLGWRVITTTTTMIRPPTPEQSQETILEGDPALLLQKVEQALESHQHITVAARQKQDEKGKLVGLQPKLVGKLTALPSIDALIVEADGSRGRSLKAPAPYEPPVPPATSILVPMMAADALGQPLDEKVAQRPELVARLTGTSLGDLITPEMAAQVIAHPEGGLKNAPPSARVIPLINKVDSSTLGLAQEVAHHLISVNSIDRVLLGAVAEPDSLQDPVGPILECWTKVAGIILAAGESRRLGRPKQLLPLGEKTMVEHIMEVALSSPFQEVVVVLGHQAEKIRPLLRGVKVVVNDEWPQGLSSSLCAGLGTLSPQFEACLFFLADQPKVTPQLVESLITRHRSTLAPIVAPRFRGQRGNPVLFARPLFPELLTLQGEEGGRSLIEKHSHLVEWVEVDSEEYFLDIDTLEDLKHLRSNE